MILLRYIHPTLRTLSKYVDGDLSPEKTNTLSVHIAECKRCRGIVTQLQSVDRALSLDQTPPAAEDILPNLKEIAKVKAAVVAEVDQVIGSMRVRRTEEESSSPVFPRMALKKGDIIETEKNARVLLRLNDGSLLWINEKTQVSLPLNRQGLGLDFGEFFAMMKPQKKSFTVKTPSALLSVVGTDFDAEVNEKKETTLRVLKGKVSFKNQAGSVTVKKKREVHASHNMKPEAKRMKDTKSINNWTRQIEKKREGKIMQKVFWSILVIALLVAGYFIVFSGLDPRHETTGTSGEGLEWKQNYTAGNSHLYCVERVSESETHLRNRREINKSKTKRTIDVKLTVLPQREGGTTTFDLEYLRIREYIDVGTGKPTTFDSDIDKPAPDETFGFLGVMIGSHLQVSLDRNGKLEKIVGADDIKQVLWDSLENLTAEAKRNYERLLDSQVESLLLQSVKDAFGPWQFVPTQKSIGDRWTVETEIPSHLAGRLVADVKCHLANREERTSSQFARVKMTASFDGDISKVVSTFKDHTLEKSEVTGQLWFDTNKGTVFESHLTHEMTIDIDIPASRGAERTRGTNRTITGIFVSLLEEIPVNAGNDATSLQIEAELSMKNPEELGRFVTNALATGDIEKVQKAFISESEFLEYFVAPNGNKDYPIFSERFSKSALEQFAPKVKGMRFIEVDQDSIEDPFEVSQGHEFGPFKFATRTRVLDGVCVTVEKQGRKYSIRLDEMIEVNGEWRLIDRPALVSYDD